MSCNQRQSEAIKRSSEVISGECKATGTPQNVQLLHPLACALHLSQQSCAVACACNDQWPSVAISGHINQRQSGAIT